MSLPQVISDLIKASKQLTLISLKERLMYLDLLNSQGQYTIFSKFLRELPVGHWKMDILGRTYKGESEIVAIVKGALN